MYPLLKKITFQNYFNQQFCYNTLFVIRKKKIIAENRDKTNVFKKVEGKVDDVLIIHDVSKRMYYFKAFHLSFKG